MYAEKISLKQEKAIAENLYSLLPKKQLLYTIAPEFWLNQKQATFPSYAGYSRLDNPVGHQLDVEDQKIRIYADERKNDIVIPLEGSWGAISLLSCLKGKLRIEGSTPLKAPESLIVSFFYASRDIFTYDALVFFEKHEITAPLGDWVWEQSIEALLGEKIGLITGIAIWCINCDVCIKKIELSS